jgi:hypothetical protein
MSCQDCKNCFYSEEKKRTDCKKNVLDLSDSEHNTINPSAYDLVRFSHNLGCKYFEKK